jgi:hypothetical protein
LNYNSTLSRLLIKKLFIFTSNLEYCANEKKTKRKSSKKKKIFAKYYEEVPVGYMPEFVHSHLKKTKYMSICFDYGHGKFSEMDTLHHK